MSSVSEALRITALKYFNSQSFKRAIFCFPSCDSLKGPLYNSTRVTSLSLAPLSALASHTDMQSESVRQLHFRVTSNLGPLLLSIMGTICSYCNQPTVSCTPAPATPYCISPARATWGTAPARCVCESSEAAQQKKLCIYRMRNLEQVWVIRKRKNRVCLCAQEPQHLGAEGERISESIHSGSIWACYSKTSIH